MKPLIERLLDRIEIDDNGCWLWTGSTINTGYGQYWDKRRTQLVHRMMYEQLVGPIRPGLVIDHLCRVRLCCNPDHLEPVTNEENLRRGVGTNATKTHCLNGHEFSPDNTYVGRRAGTGSAYRLCRTCHRARSLAHIRAKREVAA